MPMKPTRAGTVKTEVTLDASPEKVWEVLTDFEAYPLWNPFVCRLVGEAAEGQPLVVTIKLPGKAERSFRARVLRAAPAEELSWRGRLAGVNFLFVGDHHFYLEDEGLGRTRVLHEETFTGLLPPLMLNYTLVERGFEAMNEALKKRVG